MEIGSVAAVLLLLLMLGPPVALVCREVYRFLDIWFRGYRVREVADRPLGLSQRGRSGLPTKVCPGCGQVIALAAGECRYCLLRFDPAPLYQPAQPPRQRPRRRMPRPSFDLANDPDLYEPPERRRGSAPL